MKLEQAMKTLQGMADHRTKREETATGSYLKHSIKQQSQPSIIYCLLIWDN